MMLVFINGDIEKKQKLKKKKILIQNINIFESNYKKKI